MPVLVRWRGDPWQEYEDLRQQGRASSVKIALGTRILTQSIRLCNRAVPVSRSLADSIRAHTRCRPQKVVPIPIPVDLARFTPVADRQAIKRQLGYEFKHIISLAMIFQYVQKVAGLERFLPALRAVVEHRQDTAVVIAGGGRLLQPFRQRHAALLDHPRIILPGHVDGVHRLIQASDIFCHFSYFDACPNVILEAWACATPVVVNDYPALVEHLEDGVTGHILTEDASIEECLSTFERLLSEPERRHEIGQQARQLAEQRFSYEAIGERLRTVVEQAQAQA
ncbi:MAG: glycosyltransferase family 4 protein [Armatimonadota bacterium]